MNKYNGRQLEKHIKEWSNSNVIVVDNNNDSYIEAIGYVCEKCHADLNFSIATEIIQMHNVRCPICNDSSKKVILCVNDN